MSSPKSTAELSELATIQVDPRTNIRLYFRSADALIKQARVYKAEGDFQHAYVFYMKYTNLGISELPKHVSYKSSENKESIKRMKETCLEALDALEQMKPIINERHQKYVERLRAEEEAKEAAIAEQHAKQLRGLQDKASQPDVSKEWSLQDALKGVAGVGYDANYSIKSPDENLQTNYPATSFQNLSDGYQYTAARIEKPVSSIPPLLPPKPLLDQRQPHRDAAPAIVPPLPPKPLTETVALPLLPPKLPLEKVDTVLESGPLSTATTERGEPLRILNVPKSLQNVFLEIAQPNTQRNIETCGILAGKLRNNILTVTTLIIPKQTGTSDTCTTENEEELFEFQDKHDLLTFGWIHTHPTQSCFLSSVDLHTHCSYQLMLPEAIAIVCAPKHKPDFGIFRMTDPPGLDIISTCKAERAFHPHPDLPIYTDTNDGHVHLKDYSIKIEDLRA
ncbi:hypothetical protein EC973_002905 [Apophysomyces ossiformis]|uniref:MPN domain-containing protein n=1 Tax=Apophysomyces ossiformis TaxID=679940 RepID=A0A8H7BN57_9FUNG|nr:hypothetical protein EC973_002905 [Apophysomyces ossiformis]